jgi:hypothetical protein
LLADMLTNIYTQPHMLALNHVCSQKTTCVYTYHK